MRTEDLVKFNDYAQQYAQDEMQRAALQIREHRLAAKLQPKRRNRLLLALLILLLLALVAAPRSVAQSRMGFDAGDSEFFHASALAFKLGDYYFYKADYENALLKYHEAIDALPAVVWEVAPADYANLCRRLGQTQLVLGLEEEAGISFREYLRLAANNADPHIVAYLLAIRL